MLDSHWLVTSKSNAIKMRDEGLLASIYPPSQFAIGEMGKERETPGGGELFLISIT